MIQKTHTPIRTACRLATALLMTLLIGACQQNTLTDPNGNSVNPDGTVTITHLDVSLGGAQSVATRADVGTRTALTPEEDAKVKTQFNTADVLHVCVAFTEADFMSGIFHLSTATLGADGRWALSPTIRLPQHAPDVFSIGIFYDGQTTVYNKFIMDLSVAGCYDKENYFKAVQEASCHVNTGKTPWPNDNPWEAEARTDANGNAYFRDALICSGGEDAIGSGAPLGSLTIGASGTLRVEMIHANALVRISAITNQLGSPVVRAELLTTTATLGGSPYTTFTLRGTGEATTPGILPWQAVIGPDIIYAPQSIRLTLADDRQFTIALQTPPNHDASSNGGFKTKPNHVYAYRLSLLPGSLTATPDNDPGSIAWDLKDDPTVPQGYTPIRTRADLEAIGASLEAMKGNYILMNDIDLTPANPANPTPQELWTPLGYKTDKANPDKESSLVTFKGRFNGNGYTLRGLTIKSDRQQLGLFAQLSEAIVYNLHLSDAKVEGTQFEDFPARGIGTLAGVASVSTISLCSATACTVTYGGTASTSAMNGIGALIGTHAGGSNGTLSTLTHCHATRCTVAGGNANYAGGLIGRSKSDTRMAACYTRACTVTGGSYAGGLMGGNDGQRNTLYGCYAASTILTPGSGLNKAYGALVGINYGVNNGSTDANLIASCYATPVTPLKLVGINGTHKNDGTSDNTDGNARIIACVSPLTDPSKEEPNRTDAGVPIVSITARGTAQGYLPLLDDPTLTLTTPRVVCNTTGGIDAPNHAWSLQNDIWSTLKDDNNKVLPPMIKWE